jgi:quinolinate synthase
VNTTAAVKAECDICCTSGNAQLVVKKAFLKDDEIIFVPDQHLADYISKKVGRDFIIWSGFCPTHARILAEDILSQKARYPEAKVIAHPECASDVIRLSDLVLSTGGMLQYVAEADDREFIICTETGILHRLKKENPGKLFHPVSERAACPNMKLTTLEKVLWSMEEMGFEVTVPQDIMNKARTCLQRMIDYKP